MRTKKTKNANYLKLGFFLFGISLLLWNCEKQELLTEEPIIVNTIDKISSVFNKEQFKEVIPYQFNVNWQNNGIKYSKELETSYYEFNLSYTSSLTPYINIANKKIGDYYKSFKIVATVNNEKELVSFYALRVYQKIQQTGEPIANINFESATNFNGIIHVINIHNQIVFAKKLEQGKTQGKDYFSNEFKNLNPYKNKYLETCVTVGTYHYKDWYKKWTDEGGTHTQYVSTQYLGYSEEEICGYEWLPDSNGAGGTSSGTGTANGTGTYKGDCSNTNSKTKYFAKESEDCAVKITEEEVDCGTGYQLNDTGECIKEVQIFNNLTGKARCLNNSLTENGNDYVKNILTNFQGDSKFDIQIESKDKVEYNGIAVTGLTRHTKGENTVYIDISTDKFSTSTALAGVRSLLHEYIHADMYRKIYTTNYDGDLDFKTTYESFKKDGFQPTAQHETMAQLYLNSMRDALKNFHKNALTSDYDKYTNYFGSSPTDTFYEALAWQGLANHGVKAYTDLSDSRKKEIYDESIKLTKLTEDCPN